MTRRSIRVLAILMAFVASGCSGSGSPSPSLAPQSTLSAPTSSASAPVESAIASPSPAVASTDPGTELVDVPGTHLRIAIPEDFTMATRFSGLEHPTGSTVIVAEFPVGYGTLLPQMTDAAFAQQGVTVENRDELTLPDGSMATLISGSQTADVEILKAILVTGDSALTGVVTGTVPATEVATMDTVVTALRTLEFDTGRDVDPTQSLSFELTPTPPLRFAGAIGGSATYNTSGVLPNSDPLGPTLLVGPSLGTVPGGDLEAFARNRLGQYPNLSVNEVESVEPVTIDGLNGIEIVASATQEASSPVFLYQVVLADDLGYVLMLGRCREEEREDCLSTMRDTAATFRFK